MKHYVALAALLCAAPSTPQATTLQPKWSSAIPPVKYQRTGLVPVVFVPPEMIRDACSAVGEPPTGSVIVACTRWVEVDGQLVRIVVMPTACAVAEVDPYAAVMCHEQSHYLANWKHETE